MASSCITSEAERGLWEGLEAGINEVTKTITDISSLHLALKAIDKGLTPVLGEELSTIRASLANIRLHLKATTNKDRPSDGRNPSDPNQSHSPPSSPNGVPRPPIVSNPPHTPTSKRPAAPLTPSQTPGIASNLAGDDVGGSKVTEKEPQALPIQQRQPPSGVEVNKGHGNQTQLPTKPGLAQLIDPNHPPAPFQPSASKGRLNAAIEIKSPTPSFKPTLAASAQTSLSSNSNGNTTSPTTPSSSPKPPTSETLPPTQARSPDADVDRRVRKKKSKVTFAVPPVQDSESTSSKGYPEEEIGGTKEVTSTAPASSPPPSSIDAVKTPPATNGVAKATTTPKSSPKEVLPGKPVSTEISTDVKKVNLMEEDIPELEVSYLVPDVSVSYKDTDQQEALEQVIVKRMLHHRIPPDVEEAILSAGRSSSSSLWAPAYARSQFTLTSPPKTPARITSPSSPTSPTPSRTTLSSISTTLTLASPTKEIPPEFSVLVGVLKGLGREFAVKHAKYDVDFVSEEFDRVCKGGDDEWTKQGYETLKEWIAAAEKEGLMTTGRANKGALHWVTLETKKK